MAGKLELPFDFLGNIGPWDDALITGNMDECVERLEELSPLDAVRLVLWCRRKDSHTGLAELDTLAEHLGVFTNFDEEE